MIYRTNSCETCELRNYFLLVKVKCYESVILVRGGILRIIVRYYVINVAYLIPGDLLISV